MKLKKLIADLPIQVYRGSTGIEITGLCAHSKLVAPGNLFIAKKGSADDGAKYIDEAVSAGATAILTEHPDPFLKGVTQLLCPQNQDLEAKLAARFNHYPAKSLYMIGITGTNGKTTTAYLIKYLFDQLGFSCGLIGTIENIIGNYRFISELTTPGSITLQKLLKEMVKQHCNAAVLEITSHSLAQGRCDEIDFDSGIFTNLSQDHLDYHGTIGRYANEKAKLFSRLDKEKTAIVNYESEWKDHMLKDCTSQILTYGFSNKADLYADEIELSETRTKFSVHYRDETVFFEWSLIGRYNILNCLAAIASCLKRNVSLRDLPPFIKSFPSVSGRLEKVENQRGLNIYVDYAHTPDALEKVLSCLREIKQTGRVITVFGCGGNRDRGKRPKMGKVAEERSDFVIVTSDNPRSENPETICTEIAMGFSSTNFMIEVDRKEAIKKAMGMATSKDLILIAGKGHETYQSFACQTIPFDDRRVVQEIANI